VSSGASLLSLDSAASLFVGSNCLGLLLASLGGADSEQEEEEAAMSRGDLLGVCLEEQCRRVGLGRGALCPWEANGKKAANGVKQDEWL